MRIAEVPFAFTVRAVPRSGTVARDIAVRGTLPVRVAEVSPDEAPVAATLGDRSWHAAGGRLYEAVAAGPLALVPWGSPLLGDREVPDPGTLGLRRVDGSDHAEAMAAAQAYAEGCLALGDRFLVPSPGPCLSLSFKRSAGFRHSPSVVPVDPRDVGEPFLAFGAADAGRFWEWAAAEDGLRAGDLGKLRAAPDPGLAVRIPEALDFDVEALCLVKAARYVFDTGLTNRMVGAYPSRFLEGWLAYRDGSVDAGAPGEGLAGLLRAAGAAEEEVGRGDETEERLRALLRVARWAASRWDARPAPAARLGGAP